MDAKSKANFINAVAAGTTVPCPKCGAANKSGSKFCVACGSPIAIPDTAKKSAPAFAPIKEKEQAKEQVKEPVKEPVKQVQVSKYVEPNSVFAEGLPSWSLEPPQVLVRRH